MGAHDDIQAPQLRAELHLFSAGDALQWARTSGLTGRIDFTNETNRITLLFDHGRLIYAEAQDSLAAFGRHLFAEGLVDEVDLAAATVYGHDNQKRLGAVMVELGILPKAKIKPELHRHTLNLASIPLTWTSGSVVARSSASEIMPVVMTDPVDPTHLLIESARRVDETRAMRRRLPHDSVQLVASDRPAAEASPRQRRVLELLEPGLTLGELYERIGGAYFDYLESVHELVGRGLLDVEPGEATAPDLEREPMLRGADREA